VPHWPEGAIVFEHIALTLAQDDAPSAPVAPTDAPATNDQNTGTTENAGQDGSTDDTGNSGGGGGLGSLMPMLMIMFVVMIFFSMRGSSKEKKKRAKMVAAIKKGDKVQTIGGILGTVVQVNDADISLKVDENTGAKITVSRTAVQSVVEEKEE
jgi:preprotein translocase subunit YajC